MAWISLHQSLRDHRKVLQAADDLNIAPAHMVGLLSLLWLWAIDNAVDGNLSRVTSRVISRAAQWDGDADAFVMTLKRAGFIDDDTNEIHDWLDYSGKLVDQRETKRSQNRERQQRFRDKKRVCSDNSNGSDGKTLSRESNALISDSTVPNTTLPIGDISPLPPFIDADIDASKKSNPQEKRFDEFWAAYPKKVGKTAAKKSWLKVKPDKELHSRIMSAISASKQSEQWRRDSGRYIPNPATWLNQGRWDDEVTTTKLDASFDLSDIEALMRQNSAGGSK